MSEEQFAVHRKHVLRESARAVVAFLLGAVVRRVVARPPSDEGDLGEYSSTVEGLEGLGKDQEDHLVYTGAYLFAGPLGAWIEEEGVGRPPWFNKPIDQWAGIGDNVEEFLNLADQWLPNAYAEDIESLAAEAKDLAWDTLFMESQWVLNLAGRLMREPVIDEHIVAIIETGLTPIELAFHEAGHALVGTFLGADLEEVTLDPEPVARFYSYPDAHSQGVIGHAGCLSHWLAGGVREKPNWYGSPILDWQGTLGGDATNVFCAWEAIAESQNLPKPVKTDIDWALLCKDQAWELLIANYPKLDGLARLLLEKRRLSGDEVRAYLAT